MADQQSMINIENLTKQLEPMIRRIIREELNNLLKDVPGLFYLNPEMPLYKDMEELKQKKRTVGSSFIRQKRSGVSDYEAAYEDLFVRPAPLAPHGNLLYTIDPCEICTGLLLSKVSGIEDLPEVIIFD